MTEFLSVIRNEKPFSSLITGKTSYGNSTSLLIGLTNPSPQPECSSSVHSDLSVSILKYNRINPLFLFLFRQPPTLPHRLQCSTIGRPGLNHRVRDGNGCVPWPHRHRKFSVLSRTFIIEQCLTHSCAFLYFFLRKEVIQPHLPIRLPCYDFTPVTGPTFDSSLHSVGSLASGVTDSHGVTGGVYKTRERIHRDMLIRDY